jgi:hypothetical protein
MVNAKKYQNEKRYINADYVKQTLLGKKLIIDAAFNEVVNDNDKLCIRFKDESKILALNQTNLTILMTEYGDDTDDWINHAVNLSVVQVTFNGKLTPGVQVTPT